MLRSAKGHQEDLDDEDEEHLTGNVSSSHRVKGDEGNREQKAYTHRSKHSETELRRRSKINEREIIVGVQKIFWMIRKLYKIILITRAVFSPRCCLQMHSRHLNLISAQLPFIMPSLLGLLLKQLPQTWKCSQTCMTLL